MKQKLPHKTQHNRKKNDYIQQFFRHPASIRKTPTNWERVSAKQDLGKKTNVNHQCLELKLSLEAITKDFLLPKLD